MLIDIDAAKQVSEAECKAAEAAIIERLGEDAPPAVEGSMGNSPYSSQTVVYMATGAEARGTRIGIVPVCQSHDGAGNYKNRGRWRTVVLVGTKANGEFATCDASDRDAEQIGSSGFFFRPWTTHKAEEDSRGLGLAQEAMANAFEALGL